MAGAFHRLGARQEGPMPIRLAGSLRGADETRPFVHEGGLMNSILSFGGRVPHPKEVASRWHINLHFSKRNAPGCS